MISVSPEYGNRGNHAANRSLLPGMHLQWICIIDRSLFKSPELCSMIRASQTENKCAGQSKKTKIH